MKMGISSPHIIPFASVCDPELTYSCPPSLTAATGADTFVHLVESFTAITREPTRTLANERVFVGKNVLTDSLALDGIRLVGRSLATAYKDPGNVDARGDMMLAALYGGIVLSNAGTAAAHAIQYPVGALTHTPMASASDSCCPTSSATTSARLFRSWDRSLTPLDATPRAWTPGAQRPPASRPSTK